MKQKLILKHAAKPHHPIYSYINISQRSIPIFFFSRNIWFLPYPILRYHRSHILNHFSKSNFSSSKVFSWKPGSYAIRCTWVWRKDVIFFWEILESLKYTLYNYNQANKLLSQLCRRKFSAGQDTFFTEFSSLFNWSSTPGTRTSWRLVQGRFG